NLGDAAEGGIRLGNVTENGAAAKAGLKAGDIVLAFDDKPIKKSDDVPNALKGKNVGDKIRVAFLRGKEKSTLEVVLQAAATNLRPFGSGFLGGQYANVQDEQGDGSVETGGLFKSTD